MNSILFLLIFFAISHKFTIFAVELARFEHDVICNKDDIICSKDMI